MISKVQSPLIKTLMIDSQAMDGKCYLRLIPLIREFKSITSAMLEDLITQMSLALGQNPLGVDVLKSLWLADCTASGEVDSGLSLGIDDVTIPVSFIEHLMSSPVRFGFEENGGVIHVTYYLFTYDDADSGDDSPIQTEFGWASRFIIQQMCNTGRRIGGDPELDDLFGSLLEVPQAEMHYNQQRSQDPRLYSSNIEVQQAQSNVEDVYNRIERNHNRRSQASPQITEDENRELKERIQRMEERMQSVLSVRQQTVLPDDSSSNSGRYQKRFMPNGYSAEPMEQVDEGFEDETEIGDVQPVYVMSKGQTVLSISNNVQRPVIVRNIAVGYKKTNEMVKTENQVLGTIHPINGLANPFKSNRLNLLAHFHTAISNVLPRFQDEDYIRMMWHMSKYKATTPSEELAYQIVTKTFNLNENVVVANPFKLPFISVGMQVDDPTIVKCFRMLKNEYEALWFEEMKHLWVPDFHGVYRSHVEGRLTESSKHKSSRRDSVQFEQEDSNQRIRHERKGQYERKRSGGSSSILSMRSNR